MEKKWRRRKVSFLIQNLHSNYEGHNGQENGLGYR
jgi:hypothetical protein